jgi:hypothetical protein
MPPITKVQARKQALPGPMRVALENSLGAWYASTESRFHVVIILILYAGLEITKMIALKVILVQHRL